MLARVSAVTLLMAGSALAWVAGHRRTDAAFAQRPDPTELTPFASAKAEALLRNRLPCLGCHRLDGDGGRIGPALDDVGSRLTLSEIKRIMRDPEEASGGTTMPATPMPAAAFDLVARYLAGRRSGARSPEASRSATPAGATISSRRDPPRLYRRYCAPCHGELGGGDGFNAEYLPTRPTVHASAEYMSARSDDALYDAVAAGGYVMSRSARMPAFGLTLSHAELRGLVTYMRELCRCTGPAWSGDGN